MIGRFITNTADARGAHRTFGELVRCALALMAISAAIPESAKAADAQEYAVKAAFLVNFCEFVEWPDEVDKKDVTIGVLGHDPFGSALESIVAKKNSGDTRYAVQHSGSLSEIKPCHILFISRTDDESIKAAITHFSGKPVLTVGESDAFIKNGGIINFFIEENRVRFEINQAAAKKAGLKISAKLMRLQKKPD
jgi:hypothetical protein